MSIKQLLSRARNLARRYRRRPPPPAATRAVPGGNEVHRYKKARLKSLEPYLICPVCGLELDLVALKCRGCQSVYGRTENHYNFLIQEHRDDFKIVDTENVASNQYDHVATAIIEEHPNGLILDCGAGRHTTDYPNVIYYELVDYPSTDVLGVGERLPFRSNSFEAVFSLNVLEHTANPFRCAEEISRVLKPGGKLYCVAPFLVPLHSYPNHFFNMSFQGLRYLFEKNFEIVQHEVPLSGLPIWAVNWILRSWSEGLDGQTKEDFLNMTVKDLTSLEPLGYLDRDFVTELSTEKNFELATTTMLIGKKSQA
jgi:SAM-dependent methyltransferase